MFLNFCESVGNDLSVYDEDEAWPSLFDDFVEYENDQANQNYETVRKEPKEDSPLSWIFAKWINVIHAIQISFCN